MKQEHNSVWVTGKIDQFYCYFVSAVEVIWCLMRGVYIMNGD